MEDGVRSQSASLCPRTQRVQRATELPRSPTAPPSIGGRVWGWWCAAGQLCSRVCGAVTSVWSTVVRASLCRHVSQTRGSTVAAGTAAWWRGMCRRCTKFWPLLADSAWLVLRVLCAERRRCWCLPIQQYVHFCQTWTCVRCHTARYAMTRACLTVSRK